MRTCHACNSELTQAAITAGQCPECGTVLRKLSQRTIEDKNSLRDAEKATNKPTEDSAAMDDDLVIAESLDIELTDTDENDRTIEANTLEVTEVDENADSDDDDNTPLEEPSAGDQTSLTVADQSDLTMEFMSLPESGDPEEPKPKSKRHSTHTLEKDHTIELAMSPADARHMDSQWSNTFDLGAKQGQTIRQRETISGFRSTLPVKSRYVREKRKNGTTTPKSLAEVPDYELLDIIGEGGMGVVYAAHQSSIARTVAVKMLKPSAKVRDEQRDKFISEAVVTGELDHPNIVPIYDLGSNEQGALFYSMKRVRGTPWDKVIHQKQLDENLSILLRVADAVAFAHAGGVIHRDLKPENVMLGDYGEVLVMDWGLARITPEFAHVDAVYQADSLGGTPAYMAPEMAKGPVESINKTSDVYLLGALLYEIIGGQPPHSGRDVMQCLMAASQNRIDSIRYDGELKEIALKAMATQQENRYQTVKDFQEAIRVYQSHSESLVLSAHANQNLQKARESNDYPLFARALYGFQESLTLWADNHRAKLLLTETQRDYATCALEKGDLDLAASLLDTKHTEHDALMKRIDKARAERNARQRRLRMAKFAVAALLATVITTVTVASVFFRAERNKAVVAEKQARAAEGDALTQKDRAVAAQKGEASARKQAEKDRDAKEQARKDAETRRAEAELARKNEEIARQDEAAQRLAAEKAKLAEEYEAYVAQIGLAAAKINENAYEFAGRLLESSKPELRNWEWGRLLHLSRLGAGNYAVAAPIDSVAYSPDGKSFVTGDRTGKLAVRDARTGAVRFPPVPHGQYVLSVAYSPDGRMIASGSSDKTIKILDARTGRELKPLTGHTDGVLTVRFSPDSKRLLSGSYDNTARHWDLATGRPLQEFKGHSWWVWAAEFSPDGNRLVTAGQDGKAIVWEQKQARNGERQQLYSQITEFTGHDGAVYSARFSPDGKLVATGGYDKMVMIWDPDDVKPIDIGARLAGKPDAKPNYLRLAGHDGPVRSVSFSPNGRLALSGSEDNTVRIWDVAAGEAVKSLRGHSMAVRSCVFSPDGKLVLSGAEDQSVRVWNVQGYQEVRVLHATVFAGHEDAVLAARFSHDGSRIVTASRDRTASLWEASSGKPLRRFDEGHEFLVSGAVFFPDGKRLATGAGDNSVRIWDLTAGTQQQALMPTGRIGTLAVSPRGDFLATGSPGADIKIWDPNSGKALGALSGHEAEISSLAFSPSGDRLASGDDRGTVRMWKRDAAARAGSPGWVLERELGEHNGPITAVRFTPDGKRLVTASGDRTCGQWDATTGAELRPLVLTHDEFVSSLDISADGKLAITTSDDGVARIWRLADAAELASVKSPGKAFNSAGFSPDASTAVLTSAEGKRGYLWDVSTAVQVGSRVAGQAPAAARPANAAADAGAQLLKPLIDFGKLGGEVWAAMFAPNGRHLLTMGGNDAQLWDIDTRRPVVRYSPHGAVASADVSPNGKLIATGSWDHSAKIWDASTGRAIRKLEGGHTGYINSVQFSPDGAELLTASDDGTARLWNVSTGKPTGTVFRGHKARLFAATFSPDGSRVLTASGDTTARIWNRVDGKMLRELPGHKWAVLCGQFSADGSRIITGSQDNTAKIWDANSGDEIKTLAGHTAAITSVAFSPDGSLAVSPGGSRALTGSRDNSAKLWDAQTGKEILSLPGHSQEVTSVSFSPDGLNVLTSSRDGTAIIWLASEWRNKNVADTGLRKSN